MVYIRRLLPYAFFMNGSNGRFQDATALRNDVIQLVNDYGVDELYVPIITSDGRASFKTTTGREEKYPGRDILNEVRSAVISTGRTVGKGSNDVRIVAWVEGPFMVYVGHVSVGGSLNPIGKWGTFAQLMKNSVLRDSSAGSQPPALESVYNDGNVYLDPFSTEVKDNLRKTILEAAYKGWVTAVFIDDHFGVDTRTTVSPVLPKVRTEILKRNSAQSVSDPNQWIRDQLSRQLNDIKYELSSQGVELWASTNIPEYARVTQLQDVASWVSTGKINRLNIQLYRNAADFDRDWPILQREVAAIPQLSSQKVYLSIALTASNSGDEMVRQISKIEDSSNPVPAGYAVGFEDQSWMAKQKAYGG
jgi:Glycosyl hydrolase-like 10